MRQLAAALIMMLAPMAVLAQAAFVDGDGARDEFLYAWKNIARLELPVADSPKLRRYPLYVYLQAERLRVELGRVRGGERDTALEARASALVDQLRKGPAARGPHRDLLGYFGSRSLWSEFLAQRARWPDFDLPDDSLRCHEFSARLAGKDLKGLQEKVFSQWVESRSTPKACEAIYAWLDSPQVLAPADIEKRARYAARRGLPAPASLVALPEARRKVLEYWRDAEANPEKALRNFISQAKAPLPAAEQLAGLLELYERLARQDSRRATPLFEPLVRSRQLDDASRAQLRRYYALGLAYDHDAEAVKQFAQLPLSATDALSHEWRLRSALWHDDWRRVATWLPELPPDMAKEPRWHYWQGRLAQRRGDKAQAATWYASAAKEREYYGFLAAERQGIVVDLRHRPLPEDWPTMDLLASTPALRRARELLACDLGDLAAAEFNFALRELPDSAKPQLIRLASNWGWHDRAVILQAQLGLWSDLWLRFPQPFNGEIDAAARDTQLPRNWLYAVLRTESLYNPRAVSSVGARGLLQLMPATARAVAQRAGMKPPSDEDLFKPEINIALGARYLREMNDKFGGALILTLAAYNAGPHRVSQWMPKSTIDGDIWVENIPYNETRGYVQRALSSLVMMGWRRSGEPAPILPLLDPVGPLK